MYTKTGIIYNISNQKENGYMCGWEDQYNKRQ